MHADPARLDDNARLSDLIRLGRVRVLFQPILDLAHGALLGFEALTRPGEGSLFSNAGEMFDAAARQGRLWDLESVTRGAALRAAAEWPASQLLFLNTTPDVFADPRFPDTVRGQVAATPGLTPNRIVLEITEKAEGGAEGLPEQVRRVREAGFQVAIDDTGAGVNGLNRITQLRPEWLKLDRALIEGIDTDRVRQNLIRFFMHFARLSGVRVIAEGMERREELATLIELGVPFGQGFLLGRPGSREQTVDPDMALWMRSTWAEASELRFSQPSMARVGALARPLLGADARLGVGDAAAMLLRDREARGLMVLDAGRYLGWADRTVVLRAVTDRRTSEPLAFLATPDAPTTAADASVREAMQVMSSRPDHAAPAPLVLLDAGRPVGGVTAADLLRAAAELLDRGHARTVPVTGLPGRVRCDEHLATLLASPPTAVVDAAVIDVREFASYNIALGYELGDELLRRVARVLTRHVGSLGSRAFIGSFGDDRFLVTGPAARLRARLSDALAEFDRVSNPADEDAPRAVPPVPSASAPAAPAPPNEPRADSQPADPHHAPALRSLLTRPPRVALRAVLVHDVRAQANAVQDFHRLINSLRAQAPAQPDAGSQFIESAPLSAPLSAPGTHHLPAPQVRPNIQPDAPTSRAA